MAKCHVCEIFRRAKGWSVSRKATNDKYDCPSSTRLASSIASLRKIKDKGKRKCQSELEEESISDNTRYSLSSTLVDDRCSATENDSRPDPPDHIPEIPVGRRSIDHKNIAAVARTIQLREKGMEKYTDTYHCAWSTGKTTVAAAKTSTLDSHKDSGVPGRGRNTFLEDPNFLDIVNLKRGISVVGDDFVRQSIDDDLVGWLKSWDRITNGYEPEVWGDLLSIVEAAEQEMIAFTKGFHWVTEHIVVNQLQIALDRLQNDQALRESRLKYISEKHWKVRNSNKRVQTHVSYGDLVNYEKAKKGIPTWSMSSW